MLFQHGTVEAPKVGALSTPQRPPCLDSNIKATVLLNKPRK
jgi:hypothetical protein